jgi:hypothetical protein
MHVVSVKHRRGQASCCCVLILHTTTVIALEWLRIVVRALPGIVDTGSSSWRYLR